MKLVRSRKVAKRPKGSGWVYKGPPEGLPASLEWERGRHSGLYDAYLTLKTEHPRIAEKFRVACLPFDFLGEDSK